MSDENINEPNLDQSITEHVEHGEESEEEAERVLTLADVLEMEDELEEATAVLGAASDKSCSYAEGYVKRQALYSCLTCIPEAKEDPEKGAGVCLACSYHCHDGHDLVELYTKRNFRCDCGNSKFPNVECNLINDKNELNDLNSYNQNFSGMYCVCHRPFPDPEDPVPDEMIQCIICEDWYHTRHLGTEVPSNNFAEMICESCVTKHEFLLHYDAFCLNKAVQALEEHNASKEQSEENSTESYCKKPTFKSPKITAKFWGDVNWRKALCTCDDCLRMYENEDVAFLLDSEDPVHLYEEKGRAREKELTESREGEFMNNMMKNMDRVALVDCIAGYNELKENLGEFLKKFAESKKVVREEDVREFFDGMNARKKQKVDVPHFCH